MLFRLADTGPVRRGVPSSGPERDTFWGGGAGAVRATIETVLTRLQGDPSAAEQLGHAALVAHHRGGFRPQLVHTSRHSQGSPPCRARTSSAPRGRRAKRCATRWVTCSAGPTKPSCEADLAAARAAIGDDEFDAAFADGHTLDEEAAVAYAQQARGERKRPTTGWDSLTPTEMDVVRLVASGLTNKEVGRELLMGAETVKTHLSHVYDKLGVRSRRRSRPSSLFAPDHDHRGHSGPCAFASGGLAREPADELVVGPS